MCQVPEHEAVQLCSAATCVAACFPGAARGGGALFKVSLLGEITSIFWGGYPIASPRGTQSSSKSTFPRGTRLMSILLLGPRLGGGTPLLTCRKRTPW